MTRTLFALAVGVCLSCTACAGGNDSDTEKVNGSVQVAAGQPADDASTVNGSVRIADGAQVKEASTVNGGVTLGDNASATKIHTVNGSVTLGQKAKVAATVEAVNGSIKLADGADVAGKLSNVNGGITLESAHVGGGIETTAGDVTITGASRVEGGLRIDKPNGGWFHVGSDRPPKVIIGPGAVVTGTLDFQREVELHISDRAQVGQIKGAVPQKYSGETP